mmetsp:Transcript_18281/g.33129  ORF Transcript_18281/g.33129 Transcript_18281/m.33129 type:complete len:111 (-) Transcript_18281:95-427(-)
MAEARDARFYLANAAAAGLLTIGVSQLCASAKVAKPGKPLHWTLPGALGASALGSAVMLVNRLPFAGLAGCISAIAPAALMNPKEVDIVTTALSATLCGWLFLNKHLQKK